MANDSKFLQDCIDSHNQKRALHGAPSLRLAKDLNSSAQAWADTIAKSGRFAHSQNRNNVGENIAMKWSSDPSFVYNGSEATEQWYSEVKDYTYGSEILSCGHFTQVVWKGSTEVGFGRAKAADGKMYIVGHYRPAGNVMGHWGENVLPPQKGGAASKAEKKTDAASAEGASSSEKSTSKKKGIFSIFKKSK